MTPTFFFAKRVNDRVGGARRRVPRGAKRRVSIRCRAQRSKARAGGCDLYRSHLRNKKTKMRILRRKEFSYVVSDKRVGFEVEIAYALILTEDNKTVIA